MNKRARNATIVVCAAAVSVAAFLGAFRCGALFRVSKEDRILILAPHPDDETLGAGGVIQRAVKAGARVKVVCVTKGRMSLIARGARDLSSADVLEHGERRGRETVAAMALAGLAREDIIFLGYPDAGLSEILTEHWNKDFPYTSPVTVTAKVLYPDALSPDAALIGQNILKDLKTIIRDFRPTKIFVPHPADTHRDHRAVYVFLKVALFDLAGQIPPPSVFPFPVHFAAWPPASLDTGRELEEPARFRNTRFWWKRLWLTKEEVRTKLAMINSYQSELVDDPFSLTVFCKQNELFGDYPELFITGRGTKARIVTSNVIDSVRYARKAGFLVMTLSLNTHAAEAQRPEPLYFDLILLGYSRAADFASMPKIHVIIGQDGVLVRDKNATVRDHGIEVDCAKTITIRIPLAALHDPDYVFNCLQIFDMSSYFDATAWRVLRLK